MENDENMLIEPPRRLESPHKNKIDKIVKEEKNSASTRWKHRMHVGITIILAVFVFLSACVAAYTMAYPAWKTTELVAKIMAPARDSTPKLNCKDPCKKYTENFPTASASIQWFSDLPCPPVSKKTQAMARAAAQLFGQDPSHIAFSCSRNQPYWVSGDTVAINSHLIVHALESPQDEFAYAPYVALPAMVAAGIPAHKILKEIRDKPMGSARELPKEFTVQEIMVTAAVQQICAHAHAENTSAAVDLAPFVGCADKPARD